jgi:hypothetical protein
MKYALAVLNRLFELYGPNLALGYDIACAFMKTVANSSLGVKAKQLRLRGVVPAFHGHAHNRGCQVHWHPRYIPGIGIEDFEECERFFSGSNALAACTRLSSEFHRRQQILEYINFHDLDKHAESGECLLIHFSHPGLCLTIYTGNFIYQNYKQALDRIQTDSVKLQVLSAQLGTGPEDYEAYLNSEREYLLRLQTEPADVSRTVEYMECLSRLENALYVFLGELLMLSNLIYL